MSQNSFHRLSKLQAAYDELMNLQPHIAQLPEQYRPFIDSHVDVAMAHLQEVLSETVAQQSAIRDTCREERRVYRRSPEYAAYLQARFHGDDLNCISFAWEGKRWKYEHTDFDDRGDFDVLLGAVAATDSGSDK